MKLETIAAQGLGWIDETTGGVMPPIHVSTTFVRDKDNSYPDGRIYSRPDNASYDQPEAVLTSLEKGQGTLLFSSGMAAATAVFLALAPGQHVIAPKVMYWALRRWLQTFATDWGLKIDFVDMTNLAELQSVLKAGETKLVWVETPANPLWTITDIAGVAEIAHSAGAKVCVDSTAATPVLSRPIELGADFVMHSATKYLNGHSDLIAGALVARCADAHWEKIKMIRARLGSVPGSLESWLLMRGMRTLFPRVRTAVSSADTIARCLSKHSEIKEVLYPGLAEFHGHKIAARQMNGGFGAMLSIRVKGGEAAAIGVAARVKIWKRATSMGSVESLIEHRASIEGPDTPVPADLLRLSVGIENTDDLIEDITQALHPL